MNHTFYLWVTTYPPEKTLLHDRIPDKEYKTHLLCHPRNLNVYFRQAAQHRYPAGAGRLIDVCSTDACEKDLTKRHILPLTVDLIGKTESWSIVKSRTRQRTSIRFQFNIQRKQTSQSFWEKKGSLNSRLELLFRILVCKCLVFFLYEGRWN